MISDIIDPLSIIKENFYRAKYEISDINEHIETLKIYAQEVSSVCEFGVRTGVSTWGLLQGLIESKNKNLQYIGVDIIDCEQKNYMKELCEKCSINYSFIQNDSAKVNIPSIDLLFIDSWHVYGHLKRELENSSKNVNKYIILHDTTVDEVYGESIRGCMNIIEQSKNTGYPIEEITKGLGPAIQEFLDNHDEWILFEKYTNNNGLTILKKKAQL